MSAGAEAFKKDIKDAQISLLNGGQFVLEEKHAEAALIIQSFLFNNGVGYYRRHTVTSDAFGKTFPEEKQKKIADNAGNKIPMI